MNNKTELLDYIDFEELCADHVLLTGDITPYQTMKLRELLSDFVKQNGGTPIS
jgi:hypothetical protein|tara:strand:+ start:5833 stop:5991 length:159 start_codon:yes stop_codon:yes gene_type:complete